MDVLFAFSQSPKHKRQICQGPRTRTGCWACRDGSVKCDEKRPQCDRCKRLGRSCSYGLKLQWPEDSIARGISHGRQRQRQKERQSQLQRAGLSSHGSDHRSTRTKNRPQSRTSKTSRGATFFVNTSCDDIEHYFEHTQLQTVYRTEMEILEMGNNIEDREDDDALRSPCVAQARISDGEHSPWGNSLLSKFKGAVPDLFTSSVPISLSMWPSLGPADYYVLEYYDRRFVIIPLSCLSDSVRTAVLALSSRKLAYIDPRFRPKARSYHQQVLANLSKDLSAIETDPTKYLEALASTLILCWCDITDLCKSTWTKHIVGMSVILGSCPPQLARDTRTSKLMRTCRQYLIYHLIMLRATSTSKHIVRDLESTLLDNIAKWEIWNDLEDQASTNGAYRSSTAILNGDNKRSTFEDIDLDTIISSPSMQRIDTNQGFSNGLLLLINTICDLINQDVASDFNAEKEIFSKIRQIESYLLSLKQLPPDITCSNFDDLPLEEGLRSVKEVIMNRRLESIIATAEANRLGALLFLEMQTAARFPQVALECSSTTSKRMQEILNLAEEVSEKDIVTASLPIWPVFLAGCFSSEQDRPRVLSVLYKFQQERTFGTLPPACAVIESFWRQRDLSSDENPRNPHPGSTTLAFPWNNNDHERRRRRCTTELLSRRSLKSGYPWEKAMFLLKGSILSLT